MLLIKILNSIINHPLNKHRKFKAVWRFVKWQIGSKINPKTIVFPYAERSKLIIKKGLTGATGNFYCGLHEFEDMSFTLHFLRDSDTFVDIGANIGSYTVLGSSEIGARTISIEPIPKTFEILMDNINLNKVQKNVTVLNMGLGAQRGQLNFTQFFDTTNHVATDKDTDTIVVPIDKYDDIINMTDTTLVKIDVEGFETDVLNGMTIALANDVLKAIIIELNGSGERYGYDENLIHKKLLSNGFLPYKYFPFKRELKKIETFGTHNTIYLKDVLFVQDRLKSAKKLRINDIEF